MIHGERMHQRANREIARLEKLIRDGEATEHDRERYHNGLADVLAWEWAQDDTPAVEALADLEVEERPPFVLDPRVPAFLAWWDRQRAGRWPDWVAAFVWWTRDREIPGRELMDLCADISDELDVRAERERAA
jgi:hypothetical protein